MVKLRTLYVAFFAVGLSLHSNARCDERTVAPSQLAVLSKKSDVFGTRVKTSGTIVWMNPYWHSFVVVGDSNPQGVLVSLADAGDKDELRVGSRVSVEGEAIVWEGHGGLKLATVDDVTAGVLPPARILADAITQSDIFRLDGHVVAVEGRVSFVMQHFNRYILWIDGFGVPVRAEFSERAKETIGLNFAGATVRVTGVVLQRGEGPSKHAVLMLNPNGVDDVEVLTPGPVFPSDGSGVGVNGVIACRKSESRYFFRADSKEMLELDIYDPQFLTVGDMVRYVGTVSTDTSRRSISVAGLQVHATANDWVLNRSEPAKAVTSSLAPGDYCTARGTIARLDDNEVFFELLDGDDNRVRVDVGMVVGDIATLQLGTAETVEVTGYVDYQNEQTVVYPRSFEDIKVVTRRPWYASSRVQLVALSTIALLAICISFIFFLRAAVRAKTRELEQNAAILNSSYEAVREGICVIDLDGVFMMGNGRFFELLQLSEVEFGTMTAQQLYDAIARQIASDSRDVFRKLWAGELPQGACPEVCVGTSYDANRELTVYSVCEGESLGANVGRVLVFHDSTERQQLEKSLAQAQKMDAVGTLAAGIAHDFNNSLSAIVNFAEVAKHSIDPEHEAHEFVAHILEAANQAAGTTRGLLTFCGNRTTEKEVLDLGDLLGCFIGFLRRLLPANVRVTFDWQHRDRILCRVDESQLQQALLNLVINSRDAMPEGGDIRIRLIPSSDSEEVQIEIADTGVGMAPSTLRQAFDPFFSTKERGKGTGLGMAIVHGIVADHGGRVDVESSAGHGTTVTITLPIATGSISEAAPPSEAMSIDVGNTFLVVEDQQPVLESIAQQLRANGFLVVECRSAEEALRYLARKDVTVSAALVDVDLPGVSGIEFRKLAQEISPELPIVLMSGLPRYREVDDSTFLTKPFGFEQLTAAINSAALSSASAKK